MSAFDVGVIGTGPEPENRVWGESAASAYWHGDAYRASDRSTLVACADIVEENAAAFAGTYDLPEENVFGDYEEMSYDVEPAVVSVCTPVPTHADLVVGAKSVIGLYTGSATSSPQARASTLLQSSECCTISAETYSKIADDRTDGYDCPSSPGA